MKKEKYTLSIGGKEYDIVNNDIDMTKPRTLTKPKSFKWKLKRFVNCIICDIKELFSQ